MLIEIRGGLSSEGVLRETEHGFSNRGSIALPVIVTSWASGAGIISRIFAEIIEKNANKYPVGYLAKINKSKHFLSGESSGKGADV